MGIRLEPLAQSPDDWRHERQSSEMQAVTVATVAQSFLVPTEFSLGVGLRQTNMDLGL